MYSFPNLRRSLTLGQGQRAQSTPKGVSNTTPPAAAAAHPHNPAILGQLKMAPTSLDRIFLTWSGQFKNKADIPSNLDGDVIHKARSYARIRINLGFLVFAAVSAASFVYWGKHDAKKGVSMEKMNLEWHRQVNEEHRKSSGGGSGA